MQRREFLRAAGAGAGAIATGSTSVAAQENETEGGGGGGATETVAVGPDGDFVFEPADLPVQPGTTVVWEWESDNHNVAPTSIPDGATWEGHPEIAGTGTTYEHTFETEGTFEYLCEPHEAADMVGAIEVTPDAGQEEGGGGGRTVPATAMNLAIGVVAATVSAFTLVLLSLKYSWQTEE